MRSDVRGDYWLNYGAHLFPAPGSRVGAMTRECGLETVPVTGGMMGLALGSTLLVRGRVETYPFRLPLSIRDRHRLRHGRREGPARGGEVPPARTPPRLRGRPHVRRVRRPAPARGARDLLVRGASRDGGAGPALGGLRDRAIRARLGRQRLPDRAQPARRGRSAAGGAGPRARRARPDGLPRARHPARRRRSRGARRWRGDPRATRDRRGTGAVRGAARRSGGRAGRRRAGPAHLRRVPERRGRDQRDDRDALRRRLRDRHPGPRLRHVHQPGARAARRRSAPAWRQPDAVRGRARPRQRSCARATR